MAEKDKAPAVREGLTQFIGHDTDSRQSSRRQRRRRPRPRCTCTQLGVRCEICREIGERRAAAELRRLGGGR